jgi:serine/threonine protein phosphatase PrpC
MPQHAKNEGLQFDTSSVTHNGRVRKLNEDSIFASAEHGIWVVADGMGGHKDGNVASGMIADAARDLAGSAPGSDFPNRFRREITAVNERLLAISNGENDGIVGSTVVALIIGGNHYFCMWAGDSRCYLVRNGQIAQVSRDHTEVQELIDKGVISEEEARTWPRRNVITRAIGANYDVELETRSGTVRSGDCFILCSDGLTGHLEDQEILAAVQWSGPEEACKGLLDKALARGGKDNISIILVNVAMQEKTTVVQQWQ